MKKLSPTQQWTKDHPADVPCPRSPNAAKAWRIKRGLQLTPAQAEERTKYTLAMIEQDADRAVRSGSGPPPVGETRMQGK